MADFFKTNKKLIFIFFLSVFFQLVLFSITYYKRGFETYLSAMADSAGYKQIALNIINHQTFSLSEKAPFESSNLRTPIYPLWLALIFIIFGSFVPAIFIGILVFALSAPLTYLIGKEIFNEKIRLVASVLLILEPWSAFLGSFLLTEQIFVIVFLLSIYFFIKYLKYGLNKNIYISASLFSISTLVKPNVIYLFPALIIFLILFRKYVKGLTLKTLIIVAVIFIIIIAPWLVRNKIVLDSWQISSVQGFNLYVTNFNALQVYLGNFKNLNDGYARANKITEGFSVASTKGSEILTKEAVKGISNNLFAYIKISILSLPNFFINNSYGSIAYYWGVKDFKIQSQFRNLIKAGDWRNLLEILRSLSWSATILLFSAAIWPVITVFSLLGFFVAWKKFPESRIMIFSFLLIIFYFAAIATFSLDQPRYRLPVQPLILLFTATGLIYLARKIFNKGNLN